MTLKNFQDILLTVPSIADLKPTTQIIAPATIPTPLPKVEPAPATLQGQLTAPQLQRVADVSLPPATSTSIPELRRSTRISIPTYKKLSAQYGASAIVTAGSKKYTDYNLTSHIFFR